MNSHQDMFVSFILGDYHHPSQKQSVGDVDVDCRVDRVEFERFLGARGNNFFFIQPRRSLCRTIGATLLVVLFLLARRVHASIR